MFPSEIWINRLPLYIEMQSKNSSEILNFDREEFEHKLSPTASGMLQRCISCVWFLLGEVFPPIFDYNASCAQMSNDRCRQWTCSKRNNRANRASTHKLMLETRVKVERKPRNRGWQETRIPNCFLLGEFSGRDCDLSPVCALHLFAQSDDTRRGSLEPSKPTKGSKLSCQINSRHTHTQTCSVNSS